MTYLTVAKYKPIGGTVVFKIVCEELGGGGGGGGVICGCDMQKWLGKSISAVKATLDVDSYPS